MIIMIMMIFSSFPPARARARSLSLCLSSFSSQLFFAKRGELRRIYLEFEHMRDENDYRKRLTSVLIEMKSNSKDFFSIDMLRSLVSNIIPSITQGLFYSRDENPSITTCFDSWWWERTRIKYNFEYINLFASLSLISSFSFFYWSLNKERERIERRTRILEITSVLVENEVDSQSLTNSTRE